MENKSLVYQISDISKLSKLEEFFSSEQTKNNIITLEDYSVFVEFTPSPDSEYNESELSSFNELVKQEFTGVSIKTKSITTMDDKIPDSLDNALIEFMANTSYECKLVTNLLNTKKDPDVIHSNSSLRLGNNLAISLILKLNAFNQLQVDAIISLDKINGEYFGPLNFNKAKQCTGKIVQISSVIRPDSESCSITISTNNLSREIDAASITLLKRLR